MGYDKKTLPPIPDTNPKVNDVHLHCNSEVHSVEVKILDKDYKDTGLEWGHQEEHNANNVDLTLNDPNGVGDWPVGTRISVKVTNNSNNIKILEGYWTHNGQQVGPPINF